VPEGPEIHRVANQLADVLVDQGPCEVRVLYPPAAHAEQILQGRRVTSVTSHGKALLIHFEEGQTLYSHNQLYGIWQITEPRAPMLPNRRLRVELATNTATARLYSATDIELWDTAALRCHPFLSRLGPDILNPELNVPSLNARFQRPRFAKRSLQSLFLDQTFVAGLGNYLRSEILFEARLHPATKLGQLNPEARRKLARASLNLAARSRMHQGITRPIQEAKRAMRLGVDYEDARFWVFDREALPCYTCGTVIERLTAAGRRLYLCPLCQSQ
jgi:endonuclease-8